MFYFFYYSKIFFKRVITVIKLVLTILYYIIQFANYIILSFIVCKILNLAYFIINSGLT